ncbi:uncharacterized protein BO66DRAFT_468965 [Aspergillus aculeatinus CBS 121060]|uniref:Uncharacterized protein n=1 Tax=Aspergillus aculeatinus CBS 121060 TaxID=1448322 RepID=A0ACD1HI72_9EURO|nr:hypothetical protein BO66DRAFT_468965 [Aspergillus aculeatinus CBS 121060]RAH73172.1 hypothetical protein BO66DRAFT_468965 [Aspergillus aculeatinus CBS 121060]
MGPKSALNASSYQHPDGSEFYRRRIERILRTLAEQGYEYDTLSSHPVSFFADQDPWGHVQAPQYTSIATTCIYRLFESFEEVLGDRLFEDFFKSRGIGVVTNRYSTKILRPVKYPDLLITGIRIEGVRRDRFFSRVVNWSCAQDAIVSESDGCHVFFHHRSGSPVDLTREEGGWKKLHAVLQERCDASAKKSRAAEPETGSKSVAAKL